MTEKKITNPGSALGEAVGACMEASLTKTLQGVARSKGCTYLTSGVVKNKNGKLPKKLLMYDNFGNDYNIDGVIVNENMKPLIIFESKYIRYKKHNRDKGSWICNSHTAVRRRYHSIRASVAILGGEWSATSLAMIKSYGTDIFLIRFDIIASILEEYGIDFHWGEKEKEKAQAAWDKYTLLTDEEKEEIGDKMVSVVKKELIAHVSEILDDNLPREVKKLNIQLTSNLGETKEYYFDNIKKASMFLNDSNLEDQFLVEDSFSLYDIPNID
ncbi:hypothetical protein [Turicibacter sanguinis]|uniref:hypothetical protein n=1 Tax=Turicibacter sanguinis TaxID=154288 RepID=UPI00189F3FCA|nr:hypothetical protein [Turicibacter sanguinis]